MKRLVLYGALLLVGIFSAATGCGSRSADNLYLPDETAGNAAFAGNAGEGAGVAGASSSGGFGAGGRVSTGGSASGGAIGSAGASSTAGSGGVVSVAGAPNIAGAPNGGSANGGASSGGMSGGGAAGTGNNPSCPFVTPANNGVCTDTSLTCSYVGERCRCRQAGNALAWRCMGSGDSCPMAHPVADSACMGALTCPYPSQDQCNCLNGKWICFVPGCPTTKPTPGGSCGAVGGQQCLFGAAGAT